MSAKPTPRVLFVLKWRAVPYDGYGGGRSWGWMEPGTPTDRGAKLLSHGLNNSCRFVVDMLNEAGIEAALVQVADDNDIWKEIEAYQPTLVIIEAYWMRPKKLADLAERFPGLRIVIRGHSSTPFLAEDAVGFPWAIEYLRAGGIVGQNDARHLAEMRFLAQDLFGLSEDEARDRVPYLPNYYPAHRPMVGPRATWEGMSLDIGCFGAIRSLKNHVGQAIAAKAFARHLGRPLRFHINGDRLERGGEAVSRALDAVFSDGPDELVRHAWVPVHEDFLALVASMDVVMQVSFAETFNIVAADAASQGVPVVGSLEIPWLPHGWCAEPTSMESMVKTSLRAWNRDPFHESARMGLYRWCRQAREEWLRWLASMK